MSAYTADARMCPSTAACSCRCLYSDSNLNFLSASSSTHPLRTLWRIMAGSPLRFGRPMSGRSWLSHGHAPNTATCVPGLCQEHKCYSLNGLWTSSGSDLTGIGGIWPKVGWGMGSRLGAGFGLDDEFWGWRGRPFVVGHVRRVRDLRRVAQPGTGIHHPFTEVDQRRRTSCSGRECSVHR